MSFLKHCLLGVNAEFATGRTVVCDEESEKAKTIGQRIVQVRWAYCERFFVFLTVLHMRNTSHRSHTGSCHLLVRWRAHLQSA